MNLRQLELLRAVIRYQTTIGAGRELGLSQPAVSNALKHLESQIGFPLFERINNRLFPTKEAQTLYEDSDPIFALHAALEVRIQDFRENKTGHVRLVATPPLGYSIIPRALQKFLREMPKVRVSLDVRHLDQVLESVDTGLAELGFVLALNDQNSTIEAEPFYEGNMVCVMRSEHPLAHKSAILVQDLTQHAFIALDRNTRMGAMVYQAFVDADQPYNFSVEVRYCHTACLLAGNGVGVAIVDPLSPLCAQGHDLIVKPFEPICRVTASIVRSGKRPLSRPAKAFVRQIRTIAEAMP